MRRMTIISIIFIMVPVLVCNKPEQSSIPSEYKDASASSLFREGNRSYKEKDYEKASRMYQYVIIKAPSNPFAHFRLARAFACLGKNEEAVRSLLRAAELEPNHVRDNIDDPDLKPIRNDPRVLALLSSAGSDAAAGPRICRIPRGPEDTAELDIVLRPDHSVTGRGSRTGATLNLQFDHGTWREQGDDIIVSLTFKGKSYGPEGSRDVSEEKTVPLRKSVLSTRPGKCFEIDSF